jgi:hypothetical protein
VAERNPIEELLDELKPSQAELLIQIIEGGDAERAGLLFSLQRLVADATTDGGLVPPRWACPRCSERRMDFLDALMPDDM